MLRTLLFVVVFPLSAQQVLTFTAVSSTGQPVLDLSAAEIHVADNGKTRPVVSLERVDAKNVPTVLLLDLMNTQASAWSGLKSVLPVVLRKAPSVSLYLITGDGQLQPVRESLQDALRNVAVTRPNHLDPVGPRVRATYTALAALATTLYGNPGRKNVVWISHGAPLHGFTGEGTVRDYAPDLKKLAGSVAAANVVIYAVDQMLRASIPANDTSVDTLKEVAAITGGRLFANDQVEAAVTQALADTAAAYLLAFEPDTKSDLKFHNVKLSCTRAGVKLQTGQGYFSR